MNLRDWLIVIGIIIIVGILLDGYRRMRLARKDSLQMARDMGGEFENTPIDDYNPELPGGGARIIGENENEAQVTSQAINTLDDVSINETEIITKSDKEKTVEYSADNPESLTESSVLDMADEVKVPNIEEIEITRNEPLIADANSRIEIEPRKVKTAHAGHKAKTKHKNKAQSKSNGKTPNSKEESPFVIIINVHAKTQQAFSGTEIKKLLEACGMDHGEMSIFHRHEEDDLLSPIQFSVANAIEPGYFDPDTLDTISTPGVSFFMSLPGPRDYIKAFDYMLETAQCFARNLKGELKDEQLSIMTSQTIEHNRQRIKEFERLQLSKSRV